MQAPLGGGRLLPNDGGDSSESPDGRPASDKVGSGGTARGIWKAAGSLAYGGEQLLIRLGKQSHTFDLQDFADFVKIDAE